jgi:sortase A
MPARHPKREPRTILVRVAYFFFLTVGAAALVYVGYFVADQRIYQAVQATKFERTHKVVAPAGATAFTRSSGSSSSAVPDSDALHWPGLDTPSSADPNPRAASPIVPKRVVLDESLIGEIEIPRLGLKAAVVQGDSDRILRRAVGHLPSTALPGEIGNVALAGHRDTFFRPLRKIGPGDAIMLKTYDGYFEYRVESVEVVSPNNVAALNPTSARTLTLITCFPFYYIGSAPNRFIVRALQLEHSPQQPQKE